MTQTEKQQSQISDFSFASSPSETLQTTNFQSASSSISCTLVTTLFCLGFYFLVFMIVELITNYNEISYTYTLQKNNNVYSVTTDFVSFQTEDLVSIYLEMPQITQMDANYLHQPFANEGQKQHSHPCKYFNTNQQIKKILNMLGTPLNSSDQAIPCGQFTSLYPDGVFLIANTATNQQLAINTNNLVNFQTQVNEIDPTKQWTDITTERFKSWNQNEAGVIVTKYWGTIAQAVSGSFLIQLTLSNPIEYAGNMNIVLSNNKALTGYNSQLLFLNLFYAIISFSGSLISFIINKKYSKKTAIKQKQQGQTLLSQGNQIKVYLGSSSSTPGAKFE